MVLALVMGSTGCATSPEIYSLPDGYYRENQIDFEDEPQIERGRPFLPFDALNHYILSLPSKLILWNWQLLDHKLPERNEKVLGHYLKLNGLESVKVRHNQWDPIGQFRRLTKNSEVGALYRYTFGLLNWIRYTLIPDRIFAGVPLIGVGDHFDPFTNTINVYSGDLTILLHEGGHAKDYLQRDAKGTMAMMRLLPGIDLVEEASATADAIQYLQCIRDRENELRAYRTLIPAYSTYIAGYFGGGLEVTLPVVLVGHITGRAQASAREAAMAADYLRDDGEFTREDFLPDFCTPVD